MNIKANLALVTALICGQATFANESQPTDSSQFGYTKAFAVAVVTIIGYKLAERLYQKGEHVIEEMLINEAVDKLYTALMPMTLVNKMDDSEKENTLREKAKLINFRKQALKRLEEIAKTDTSLTEAHKKRILNYTSKLKNIFKLIDIVKTKNPYEHEYAESEGRDKIIEAKLIKSIVLNMKPEFECTYQELIKRDISKQRRAKVAVKLKSKCANNISEFVQNKVDKLITILG